MAVTNRGVLSSPFVISVVVPSTLLICSVALFKAQWTPIAVAAAACLAGVQVFLNRTKPVLDPNIFQSFPLIEKTVLSHNTAIYRFALPSPTSILGLPIGQHISIAANLDVTDPKTSLVERREVVRSYTPISSDVEPGYIDLLIKAYPSGNISRYIASLNIGDSIRIKGPKGAMVYTPNMVEHFGMIAGGTGITPMLQIIKAIQRGRNVGDQTEVSLIFANVNEEDILLRKELNDMVAADKKIHVHYVLNNPPATWLGETGFVTADMIKTKLPPPGPNMKILVCGPPPMVSAMKKATESLGYIKARPVSRLEDQVFCF